MRTPPSDNAPLPLQPAPSAADPAFAPLLSEPFASAWAQTAPADITGQRDRLLQRLRASRAAEAAMTTVRRRQPQRDPLGPGLRSQTLYLAPADRALRPGEPTRARLIDLAPGTWLDATQLGDEATLMGRHREWLLLAGQARLQAPGAPQGTDDPSPCSQRDYHVTPAGHATPAWQAGAAGALLFLRESALPADPQDQPRTVRDAEAGWPEYAPGIRRRVLWQRDGQAALLYHAQAGASVPQHRHGHDEECLMVQGELFLDDLLMQAGDYQLAPAGTGHRVTQTDTGVVLYAHGDLDLQFVAGR